MVAGCVDGDGMHGWGRDVWMGPGRVDGVWDMWMYYTRLGMYAESLRVDVLGFCGWGVMVDEGHPWQGEGSGRANTVGKPFALCKAHALITWVKRANSISPANVYEPGQ